MNVKIYKIEISVIDFQGIGKVGIIQELQNMKYIHPELRSIKEREITWSDDHPLNNPITSDSYYKTLFESPGLF